VNAPTSATALGSCDGRIWLIIAEPNRTDRAGIAVFL